MRQEQNIINLKNSVALNNIKDLHIGHLTLIFLETQDGAVATKHTARTHILQVEWELPLLMVYREMASTES